MLVGLCQGSPTQSAQRSSSTFGEVLGAYEAWEQLNPQLREEGERSTSS